MVWLLDDVYFALNIPSSFLPAFIPSLVWSACFQLVYAIAMSMVRALIASDHLDQRDDANHNHLL